MTDLIPKDATLEHLETIIETNLAGAFAVAAALTDIHDRKLYKATHKTWELYCLERWQMSRSAAWRQIEQAKVVAELPSGSPAPSQRSLKRRQTPNVAHPPTKPPVTRTAVPEVRDETPEPATFIPIPEGGGIDTSQIITYEVIIRPDADLGKAILKASKKAKMPAYDWVILAVREKLSALEEEVEQPKTRVSSKDAPKIEKALASHTATGCAHPKKEEVKLGWGVKCGLCNTVLR